MVYYFSGQRKGWNVRSEDALQLHDYPESEGAPQLFLSYKAVWKQKPDFLRRHLMAFLLVCLWDNNPPLGRKSKRAYKSGRESQKTQSHFRNYEKISFHFHLNWSIQRLLPKSCPDCLSLLMFINWVSLKKKNWKCFPSEEINSLRVGPLLVDVCIFRAWNWAWWGEDLLDIKWLLHNVNIITLGVNSHISSNYKHKKEAFSPHSDYRGESWQTAP